MSGSDDVSGSDNMRYLLRLAILGSVLLAISAFAQLRVAWDITGVLTVRSKKDARPPKTYSVSLSCVKAAPQQVANHGTFRFPYAGCSDGELIVRAEGRILLRQGFRIDPAFFRPPEYVINLLVAWEDEPNWTLGHLKTISVEDVYQRNPENAALMDQESVAANKSNYKEAIRLLKIVVDADPRDFVAWTDLGTVLFAQGNQDESGKALKQALELRPSYPIALLNYGKLQYNQKNYDASIQTLIKLVSVHPEAAEAHRYLGEAYLYMKQGSKAAPELEDAVRLDPQGQAEACLSLAALYDAAGFKDRAAAEYEKFLSLRPDYPDKGKLKKYILDNKKLQSQGSEDRGRTDRKRKSARTCGN